MTRKESENPFSYDSPEQSYENASKILVTFLFYTRWMKEIHNLRFTIFWANFCKNLNSCRTPWTSDDGEPLQLLCHAGAMAE